MSIKTALMEPFGVALFGYDNAGSEAQLKAVAELFREHSLVVLPETPLAPEEHVRLIKALGPVIDENGDGTGVSYVRHDPAAEPIEFTKGPLLYHFDLAFKDDWPIHIQSLYAQKLALTGGNTRFIHCGQALKKLDPGLRNELDNARVLNVFDPYAATSGEYRSHNIGPYAERAIHDAIRPHPYLKENVLTVNRQQSDRFVGLPREKSERLLQRTFSVMYTDSAAYNHSWRLNDLVIWDNRVVQHCRTDYDPREPRCLRRVIAGDEDTVAPLFRRWAEQIT